MKTETVTTPNSICVTPIQGLRRWLGVNREAEDCCLRLYSFQSNFFFIIYVKRNAGLADVSPFAPLVDQTS